MTTSKFNTIPKEDEFGRGATALFNLSDRVTRRVEAEI